MEAFSQAITAHGDGGDPGPCGKSSRRNLPESGTIWSKALIVAGNGLSQRRGIWKDTRGTPFLSLKRSAAGSPLGRGQVAQLQQPLLPSMMSDESRTTYPQPPVPACSTKLPPPLIFSTAPSACMGHHLDSVLHKKVLTFGVHGPFQIENQLNFSPILRTKKKTEFLTGSFITTRRQTAVSGGTLHAWRGAACIYADPTVNIPFGS